MQSQDALLNPRTGEPVAKLLLTVSEAAALAGHGKDWGYDRIHAGETFGGSVAHRPGRRIEIYTAPFLAWLREQTNAPDCISIDQAARLIGRSYTTVYHWLRKGETFGGAVIDEPGQRLRIDAAKFRAHFGHTEDTEAQAS